MFLLYSYQDFLLISAKTFMRCPLPSKTKFWPLEMEYNYLNMILMKDCCLSLWRHMGTSLISHFICFFLSSSLPPTDKLRLVKFSLSQSRVSPAQAAPILVPACSSASWTKAKCKYRFFLCSMGIKIPLHLWPGDKYI